MANNDAAPPSGAASEPSGGNSAGSDGLRVPPMPPAEIARLLEVQKMVAAGDPTSEIAAKLHVSERTVYRDTRRLREAGALLPASPRRSNGPAFPATRAAADAPLLKVPPDDPGDHAPDHALDHETDRQSVEPDLGYAQRQDGIGPQRQDGIGPQRQDGIGYQQPDAGRQHGPAADHDADPGPDRESDERPLHVAEVLQPRCAICGEAGHINWRTPSRAAGPTAVSLRARLSS
jgi:Homeodomain-like domain